MKLRCQTCFNLMEFCQCGLPEVDPFDSTIESTDSGLLIARPAPEIPEIEVIEVVIIDTGDEAETGVEEAETGVEETTLADEMFASMARHPSGAYTLIDEIERFLLTTDE